MKRLLAVLALACHAPATLACGVCIEDRIAGAYDHAVVARAFAAKHHVAFFHIDGALGQRAGARRALEALAESVPGVDQGSARVSAASPTLSLAFDPRSASFVVLHKALEKKLAPKRFALMPLKVMERPAEFRDAGR